MYGAQPSGGSSEYEIIRSPEQDKEEPSIASTLTNEELNYRTININTDNSHTVNFLRCFTKTVPNFRNNKIITSKYNFLTFLPLNLMYQFSKMANCYFLLLVVMECIKPISDTGGYPIMGLPLLLVLAMSMVKDIYEDFQRHRSDKQENSR